MQCRVADPKIEHTKNNYSPKLTLLKVGTVQGEVYCRRGLQAMYGNHSIIPMRKLSLLLNVF